MTAPVRPLKRKLSPADYSFLREQNYSDEQIEADGFELPTKAEGVLSKIGSAAAGAAQGATFGHADEIAGAVGSLLPGQTYTSARDKVRGVFDDAKAANPKTFTAGEIGGAVLSPVNKLLMPAAAAKNAGLLRATLQGAKSGAAAGALYGAGTADKLSDIPGEAAATAAFGGLAGGAFPAIARVVSSSAGNVADLARRGAKAVTSAASSQPATAAVNEASPWALRKFAQAVQRGGVSADDLEATVRGAAPDDPRLLLNVAGRKAKAVTDAAVRRADDGGEALTSAVEEQMSGLPGRVVRSINEKGPGGQVNMLQRLEEIAARQKANAGPLYDQVDQFGPILDDEITQILRTDGGKQAMRTAEKIASNRRDPLSFAMNDAGELTATPKLRDLDNVKKALDAIIEKERSSPPSITKAELAALKDLRGSLVQRLDDVTTDKTTGESFYRKARETFAGEARLREALEDGREAFARTTNADELATAVKGLSKSEREAFLEGGLQQLKDIAGGVTDEVPNFWKKLQGSETARAKLDVLFQDAPDKADELRAVLDQFRGLSKDARQVLSGSQTAQRLNEGQVFDLPLTKAGLLQAVGNRGRFLTEGRAGDFQRIAADRITDPRVQQVIAEMRRQAASTNALARRGGRAGAATAAVSK